MKSHAIFTVGEGACNIAGLGYTKDGASRDLKWMGLTNINVFNVSVVNTSSIHQTVLHTINVILVNELRKNSRNDILFVICETLFS